MRIVYAVAAAATLFAGHVLAQTYGRPAILEGLGIEQRMGARVPLDLPFTDEQGREVTLRSYLGKPVVLALVYYSCPSLCNRVLSGMAASLPKVALEPGGDYRVVAVSFDPRDDPAVASRKKAAYREEYPRAGIHRDWHFLTGPEASSKALADALGFRFAYDPASDRYVHPNAVMVLTPEGHVARYFYGISYPARDLRLGLVEASGGRIGSPVDQVLLFCFHYDPSSGKYGFLIMNVLRAAGLLTVGLLAGFLFIRFRRDLRSGRATGKEV